jgi:hypothetical protein
MNEITIIPFGWTYHVRSFTKIIDTSLTMAFRGWTDHITFRICNDIPLVHISYASILNISTPMQHTNWEAVPNCGHFVHNYLWLMHGFYVIPILHGFIARQCVHRVQFWCILSAVPYQLSRIKTIVHTVLRNHLFNCIHIIMLPWGLISDWCMSIISNCQY